jgi:hypothetical protein
LDDDLVWSLLGLLRLGNGKRNLAFHLLRTSFCAGSRFRGWRGTLCINQRGLNFTSGASRRTSRNDQGCQYQQSQRNRTSGRCIHVTNSTRQRARCMRTGLKKSNVSKRQTEFDDGQAFVPRFVQNSAERTRNESKAIPSAPTRSLRCGTNYEVNFYVSFTPIEDFALFRWSRVHQVWASCRSDERTRSLGLAPLPTETSITYH